MCGCCQAASRFVDLRFKQNLFFLHKNTIYVYVFGLFLTIHHEHFNSSFIL